MSKQIFVDSLYKDEVRIAIVQEGMLEDYAYQKESMKEYKGNIYLGRVKRVEAGLQAVFLDYGGNNKQGFLPFSLIHPSFYNLPEGEKAELLKYHNGTKNSPELEEYYIEEANIAEHVDSSDLYSEASKYSKSIKDKDKKQSYNIDKASNVSNEVLHKKYRVQDVIRKDQVILVQVLKEERGNKGVTLTTYLSLSGRFCVFMPNSNKISGISRKIEDADERVRLKEIVKHCQEKEAKCTLLMRMSAAYKTKLELTRDFSYLLRLWDNIKKHAKNSMPRSFIYDDGGLIKRCIRELYDYDTEEIIIDGDAAYKELKDFTELIMPRHVDKIKKHQHKIPIFHYYGIEQQLAQLYDNIVPLTSGGYIVINQTEALVAIDVNSGRSTKELNVEDTALKTNLEAVKEIGRQVIFRNLSGLIVIDFIDMSSADHKIIVEKATKLAFSEDKSKNQISKMSQFCLMEIARQRMGTSVIELNSVTCFACGGKGKIRSAPATQLAILRSIRDEAAQLIANGQEEYNVLEISANKNLILGLLNERKEDILKIEKQFGIYIYLYIDERALYDGFFVEKRKKEVVEIKEALSSRLSEVYNIAEFSRNRYELENGAHSTDVGNHLPQDLSINDDDIGKSRRSKRHNNKSKAENVIHSSFASEESQELMDALSQGFPMSKNHKKYYADVGIEAERMAGYRHVKEAKMRSMSSILGDKLDRLDRSNSAQSINYLQPFKKDGDHEGRDMDRDAAGKLRSNDIIIDASVDGYIKNKESERSLGSKNYQDGKNGFWKNLWKRNKEK